MDAELVRTAVIGIKLVFSAFAVFRAAELIALDDGPFAVFERLRNALGMLASRSSGKRDLVWSLAELVRCSFCVGLWFSLVPAIVLAESFLSFIAYWFIIAGMQTFLEAVANRQLAE